MDQIGRRTTTTTTIACLQTLTDDGALLFRAIEFSMKHPPRQFRVDTVSWPHAAKEAGKWYRRILEATEQFMARWHVEGGNMISERRVAMAHDAPESGGRLFSHGRGFC